MVETLNNKDLEVFGNEIILFNSLCWRNQCLNTHAWSIIFLDSLLDRQKQLFI